MKPSKIGNSALSRHPNRIREAPRQPPRRVFLGHTSELRDHPSDRSFVAAGEDAVKRAGDAVIDMAYGTASGMPLADYCMRMVARADVYVGLIGVRYGTVVPDSHLSCTELELETARSLRLPRLIFLVRPESPHLPLCRQPAAARRRQEQFRRRLLDDNQVTISWVVSPADVELQLFHALIDL